MKIILKNTDIALKKQALPIKCYETTKTAGSNGRFDIVINLSTVNAGTNLLMFKVIKNNQGTQTDYILQKSDAGGATGVVTLNEHVPFGQLTDTYDFTGSGAFKMRRDGFTQGDSFTIEVYKYDV